MKVVSWKTESQRLKSNYHCLRWLDKIGKH